MAQRVTLKDVAEHSGYSLRTVKKVFNNQTGVSEKARKKILKSAEILDYKFNRIASALAKNYNIGIAIVYNDISKYYFPEVDKGFLNCADEMRDFGVSIEFHKNSSFEVETQRKILDQLLTRKDISGVIIQPISAHGLNDNIQRLAEAGKVVATFGADAPDSERLFYIGPDAYKSGRIASQVLANYINKSGKVFIINQASEHMQSIDRMRGFRDRIREVYPNIEVYEINTPINKNMYYDMVKSIVLNEDVKGIFCTDADVYIAGNVLKELNRKDIVVVGYDFSKETHELMKQGYIKVILMQEPEIQGYLSLKILCEYLLHNKKPDDEIIYTKISIATSECLD
ncbi:MAG: substrate-binding domain-containing protein [Clostridiaceae bacterium]|nr:substrate-binding domain-containing protein [Clostridiaceae bacterium]